MKTPANSRLHAGHVLCMLALTVTAIWLASGPQQARAAEVSQFRLVQDSRGAQAILDVPAGLDYRVFTLNHPARVVLDLLNAQLSDNLKPNARGNDLVASIRYAPRFDGNGERLVFDLRAKATPRTFMRRTARRGKKQLILELSRNNGSDTAKQAGSSADQPVITANKAQPMHLRDVVIAIDPGHGGRDSGAIGPAGLEEKNVTLRIARKLYKRLSKIKGIKPVLTRTGDYYVGLAERRRIAHEHHADLFVSIHADSSPYHSPMGSTVYALSEHGASSVAARILAESENSSDKVAGITLADEQPVVRDTILKLAQRGSIARSMFLARDVMGQINDVVPLHSDTVERAAFVVLKSPDIPSILVETAFISNRHEEKQLASRRFRTQIAKAISQGIVRYVDRYAPPGTLIAARRDALYALKQS